MVFWVSMYLTLSSKIRVMVIVNFLSFVKEKLKHWVSGLPYNIVLLPEVGKIA